MTHVGAKTQVEEMYMKEKCQRTKKFSFYDTSLKMYFLCKPSVTENFSFCDTWLT